MARAKLWTDGGSRGNPGLSAAGIRLVTEGIPIIERGWVLGTHLTNNDAEYRAFVLGLQLAMSKGVTDLTCHLDSKLVVMQVTGEWGCKAPNLKPWLTEAKRRMAGFDSIKVIHIPREENHRADFMANHAMNQIAPPTL